jgi:cobalt-zinc-cadmium resistance protein CzcA
VPQLAEQYLIRGVGLGARDQRLWTNRSAKRLTARLIFMRDVAETTLGDEVRQGAVIKNGTTEAVGGIVMMMTGGNAKEVVSGIKKRVDEINKRGMLPNELKVVTLL